MTYRLTHGVAVIRAADGLSISPDPDSRHWTEYEAWLADGGVPEPAPELPPAPPRVLTPREFIDRLPLSRQGEITAAAMQSPPLLLWLIRLSSAREVDVTFPETIEGVAALRAADVITAQEVEDLLAPVAAAEPTEHDIEEHQ
ncbi:hypothetical protein [Roseococcus pinisoli]|uniref:Mu-like prophage FluMu protein gp41 n=1 Tax=Roseococcus pinisoli TaxID=2835040 RepID=A0ABS5QBY9_9PROT|nr:hypothetical protein [Roseococcus pinisoli]MBS7811215.1 hypothetical protein [Roseococcus pinisoli]